MRHGNYHTNNVEMQDGGILLIGNVRLLRRTIKRQSDTDAGRKQIALCEARLSQLPAQVQTLDF